MPLPTKLLRTARRHHLPLLVGALVTYLILATGYTGNLSPAFLESRDYFRLQAHAWADGRLDLPITSPRLDMSLYKGRIHLYWGPVNSLLPFLTLAITGRDLGMILWTTLYCVAGLTLFIRILDHLAQRYFPTSPPWLTPLFATTLAFGSPIIAIAAEGVSFHNESIALSFFLQMAIILAWLHCSSEAVQARKAQSASPDRTAIPNCLQRADIAFGLAAGLAVATRMTNLFAFPGLFAALILCRVPIRRILIPGMLIALAICLLMIYNAARFDSYFETGMRYASGFQEQRDLLYEKSALISPRWIPLNFSAYFLSLPDLTAFGQLAASRNVPIPLSLTDLFPPGFPRTLDFHAVWIMTPPLLFILLLPLSRPTRELRGTAIGLAGALGGILAFLLSYAWSARRFTVDFVPLMLILAYMGAAGYQMRRPHRQRLLREISLLLLFASVALHFPVMQAGARKATSLMVYSESASLPSPAWPALVIGIIGLVAYFEIFKAPHSLEQ